MTRTTPIAFASIALFAAALAAWPAAAQKGKEAQEIPRPRILFVFAPDAENKPLQNQYDKLQKNAGELDAADMDTIYVIGDRRVRLPPPESRSEDAANLRKRYHVDASAFRIVLIGHDGLEKARWSDPVEPNQIVSVAHEMPVKKSDTPR